MPAVGGQLDRQRGRRADADQDRRAGDGGLLHELERQPPADAQHALVRAAAARRAARGRSTLSIALWRPTSSRTQQQLAGGREQPGRVQAAGALEAGLAQPLGQVGEQRARDRRAGRQRRRVDRDLLQRALAAHPARGRRVEGPRATGRAAAAPRPRRCWRRSPRSARPRAARRSAPRRSRNPSASSSSWPGVRIVTASARAVDADLQRLLDRDLVALAVVLDGAQHERRRSRRCRERGRHRRLLADRPHVDRDHLVLGARGVDVGRRRRRAGSSASRGSGTW